MENCPSRANVRGADPGQLRRGKTVEEIYQKKTPLEHILLRPDTYVGSVEHQWQDMWIFDEASGTMVHRKIDYVPAMYKIFDEILVNAADNSMRDPKGMNLIDVTIDRHGGSISVMNNGQGVPVQMHQEHHCYVPELIFGHLLTSDNYNDNEKKVTGGRNGYGAKLANVFSKKFMVETADMKAKKAFQQVFESNMSKKHPPTVTAYGGASEFTRVTFWPDLARFGMRSLDDDIVGLMMKRVYDIAGSTNKKVKVVLNGKTLPVRCFQDYVGMYLNQGDFKHEPVYERCSDRWEVAVSLTDGNFQQVSFVNSINTIKGGTHVAHVSDQLVEALLKVVKGKNRGGIDIKPAHVRNHLWIFINCLIENPAFDSQTKETLTTKQSKFGSTCELSEAMMKKVMKSGVVEMILDWVRAKQKVDMSRQLRGVTKNTTRVLGIPKLEDANDAGGRNSADCTLILTEGDSAKSLAVAGLSVIGRDKYGVFPLKGKVLNVRDANFKQVTGNTEIQNLLKIVGLDLKRQYDTVHGLRYGSIMVMTDQDHDGSHIKGLLINLIHFWWPSLAKMDGFLKQFITPIVKVWKDGKKDGERREETSFFTMDEYEKWKQQTGSARAWKSKYYKGLGTSTMKEAKEYFRDIDQHEKRFQWIGDRDGESIDLAFNKKRADDRKNWINAYEDGTNVDHSKSVVGYSDFVHKELVQFAKYDVSRSVPSVVDGFKPSQRKVIFCAFKKKLRSDIKVAQFVGYISEQSAYHHGEASLENTIVNLAQNFVGSNNANLLVPSGQFGTRLQGGKDHAAARYIYTRLHGATRSVFHPDDDHVLDYLNEEGLSIEPKWYCPVLPTVLVNGADGIGVGWSTFIPNHDPRELIRNLRRMLRGIPMEEMHPWYKGFTGQILPNPKEPGKYEVMGVARKLSDTTLEVTELPVKTWTQSYKEFLEELMPQDGKKPSDDDDASGHLIEEFREHHTECAVHFVLTLTPAKMREAEKAGFEKTFKLKSSIATSNMVLFDANGKISKYSSSLDILKEFCQVRHQMYLKRKGYLEAKLTREKEILSNKARFILMVVKGELELRKKKKQELLRELRQLGFTPMSQLDAIMKGKGGAGHSDAPAAEGGTRAAGAAEDEPADDGERDEKKSEYDYLLGMNLWSLTFERVEEIKRQLEAKKEELRILQETTIEQIWDRDLEALSAALDEMDAQEQEEAAQGAAAASGAKRRRGAAGRAAAPAPPPPAPRGRPAAPPPDESFLCRPLVPVDQRQLAQGVDKTVWGVGECPARGAAARGGAPPEHQAPPQRRPPRQDLGQDLPGAPAPAPAGGPPGGGAGGALLSRLLQKRGPGAADGGGAAPSAQEDLFAAMGGAAAAADGGGSRAGAGSRRGRGGGGRGRGRGRGRGSGTESSGGEATEVMDLTGQPPRAGRAAGAAPAGGFAPPVLAGGFARRSLAGPALERPQLLRRRGPAAGDAARPPREALGGGALAAGEGASAAAAGALGVSGAPASGRGHPGLGWFAQRAAAERPPSPGAGAAAPAGGVGAVALDSDSDMEPLAARVSGAAAPGRVEAATGRAPLRPVAARGVEAATGRAPLRPVAARPPAAAPQGPPRKRRRRALLDDDDEDYEEHHAF